MPIIKEQLKKHLHILYIIYIVSFALFLFASCGPKGNAFRIKGSFRDMKAGEIYIYHLYGSEGRIDTLVVRDGEFAYRGETAEPVPYYLVFPNGMEQVIIVAPGDELEYEATANNLKNYVVNGSDENRLLNKFRKETFSMGASEIKATAKQYIQDHSETTAAIYLFEKYFVQDAITSEKEIRSEINILKAKHPKNRFLMGVEGSLNRAEKSGVGKVMPDATLRNIKNEEKKLWAQNSAHTVVVFWSTWMDQSYDFMMRIRRVIESHKESNVRFVMISLDVEHYRWEQEIGRDSIMNYVEHYCDDKAFESPVAQSLGVNTVPYYLITDSKHKIVYKGSSVDDMSKDLEKLKK